MPGGGNDYREAVIDHSRKRARVDTPRGPVVRCFRCHNERLAGEIAFEFAEVNIEDDPAVQLRYEREVPILFVDGRLVVRYRTSERELRRILNWQLFRRRFRRG